MNAACAQGRRAPRRATQNKATTNPRNSFIHREILDSDDEYSYSNLTQKGEKQPKINRNMRKALEADPFDSGMVPKTPQSNLSRLSRYSKLSISSTSLPQNLKEPDNFSKNNTKKESDSDEESSIQSFESYADIIKGEFPEVKTKVDLLVNFQKDNDDDSLHESNNEDASVSNDSENEFESDGSEPDKMPGEFPAMREKIEILLNIPSDDDNQQEEQSETYSDEDSISTSYADPTPGEIPAIREKIKLLLNIPSDDDSQQEEQSETNSDENSISTSYADPTPGEFPALREKIELLLNIPSDDDNQQEEQSEACSDEESISTSYADPTPGLLPSLSDKINLLIQKVESDTSESSSEAENEDDFNIDRSEQNYESESWADPIPGAFPTVHDKTERLLSFVPPESDDEMSEREFLYARKRLTLSISDAVAMRYATRTPKEPTRAPVKKAPRGQLLIESTFSKDYNILPEKVANKLTERKTSPIEQKRRNINTETELNGDEIDSQFLLVTSLKDKNVEEKKIETVEKLTRLTSPIHELDDLYEINLINQINAENHSHEVEKIERITSPVEELNRVRQPNLRFTKVRKQFSRKEIEIPIQNTPITVPADTNHRATSPFTDFRGNLYCEICKNEYFFVGQISKIKNKPIYINVHEVSRKPQIPVNSCPNKDNPKSSRIPVKNKKARIPKKQKLNENSNRANEIEEQKEFLEELERQRQQLKEIEKIRLQELEKKQRQLREMENNHEKMENQINQLKLLEQERRRKEIEDQQKRLAEIEEQQKRLREIEEKENTLKEKEAEKLRVIKQAKLKLKEKEEQKLKEIELQKGLLKEKLKVEEEERLREIERQKELMKEKLKVEEEERLKEIERQKELMKVEEEERLKEIERQKELMKVEEEERLREIERQKELLKEKLKVEEEERLKEIERQKELLKEKEEERLREIERQKELLKEKEEERLREIERQKELLKEKKEERLREIEKQKQKMREEEESKLKEIEEQKEKLRIFELEQRKLKEKEEKQKLKKEKEEIQRKYQNQRKLQNLFDNVSVKFDSFTGRACRLVNLPSKSLSSTHDKEMVLINYANFARDVKEMEKIEQDFNNVLKMNERLRRNSEKAFAPPLLQNGPLSARRRAGTERKNIIFELQAAEQRIKKLEGDIESIAQSRQRDRDSNSHLKTSIVAQISKQNRINNSLKNDVQLLEQKLESVEKRISLMTRKSSYYIPV